MGRPKKSQESSTETDPIARSVKFPQALYDDLVEIKNSPYSRMKSFNDIVVAGARLAVSLERKHIEKVLDEVQGDALTEFLQSPE